MMSAQMLSASGSLSGTIADLAPGAKDGMRLLEAKAAEMSGGAVVPKGGSILFVRGETHVQTKSGIDTSKVINPEEIDIDDEYEDEEDGDEDDKADGELSGIFCFFSLIGIHYERIKLFQMCQSKRKFPLKCSAV